MDYSIHYDEFTRNIKIVKDRVRAVVHGQATGLYLHGRPGTSKTFTVRTTLDALGASYVLNTGHLTPIGLVDLLADNLDRVIVLDDVSAIFNQPIALQVLLAALGNPHDGTSVRLVKHRTAKENKVVAFSGGIICLSNLALDGHHNEVLAAIRDRIHVIHYEPTEEHITALILTLCEEGVGGLSPADATMVAMHLIDLSKAKGIRLSVRLFVDKAVKDYQLWAGGKSETHWEDLVRSSVEQQLIELQHSTRDLSRAEQVDAECRIALDVCLRYTSREELPPKRRDAWVVAGVANGERHRNAGVAESKLVTEIMDHHHRVQSGKLDGGMPKRDWISWDNTRVLRPSPRFQRNERPSPAAGILLTHPYRLEPFVQMLRENGWLVSD